MQQIRRRRRDAEGWHTVMARFTESGLSVVQFCEREDIGAASFYRWRLLLGAPITRKAAEHSPRREPSPQKPAPTPNGFLDLGTLGTSPASRVEVRLDLGDGLVLHVVRG